MSSSISVWMYLKRQKKADAEGKIPIYVRVIIDGDREDFSLSRRVLPGEWNQTKQKCTGKSQEAQLINAKITKTKGELTRIFDRFLTNEVVRAKQVVNIYQGEGRAKEDNSRKGQQFHNEVLAVINRYLELKKREKKVLKDARTDASLLPIKGEKEQMIQSIEEFLNGWHSWQDDTDTEKTILDAQYFFLVKFMYRVLKGNASHETFRKWVSTKNTYVSFLTYRYKLTDLPLKSLSCKFAVDLHEYLTLTNSVGNNAAMKYIKNLKQIIDEAVDRKWVGQNPLDEV